jgi:seryl-tRNA synthetase
MLNERYVREHTDEVRAALNRRHAGADVERALDAWIVLDVQRRGAAQRHDALARDLAARESGTVTASTAETRAARRGRAVADDARIVLEARARRLLMRLPNLPEARVPDGHGPASNVEIRRWGEPAGAGFTPKRHDELATALGILDLPRAAKIAGARFPLLVGAGARLSRALAALMLDMHAARGYVEVAPPHLLRTEVLEGTGHLPRHEDDVYAVPRDDLYLSPTAEAQLVALHADETLPMERLPLAYTACTPAFRREAGSTRAAMKGLLRLHQFDKVELVRIATPEGADAAFDAIVADAEAVLQRLGLPYRVMALCAGELPFASQRTWDIEVWMAGQGRYVEVSSVSDCGTFQSRRLNVRYRPASGGAARFAHTLNGSALAIGRTMAALLEQGQQADGSVALPPALAEYLPTRELSRSVLY